MAAQIKSSDLDFINIKNNLKNFKLTETIIPDTYEFLYWENK